MYRNQITPRINFIQLLSYERPDAVAWINGSAEYPRLNGLVKFYQTSYDGILVEAEVFSLPNIDQQGASNFYAMHIHESGDCTDNFQHTGNHYNPRQAPHPDHAGDLLPLMGNQGYAWSAFYDKRFTLDEIIGRSVIIHSGRDDFSSQPSGDSGTKIGCGTIKRAI